MTNKMRAAVICTLILVFSAMAWAAATGQTAHGTAAGHINWWQWDAHAPPMGWFLVDFVIFAGGLVYFTARPLTNAFAQRHLTIKRAISEASVAYAKAAAQQQTWREALAKVDDEVHRMVQANQQDAEAERDQLISNARQYADRLLDESQSVADQEIRRARERLRQSLLRTCLSEATVLIKASLQPSDRQRLLEESIAGLEDISSAQHSGPSQSSRATALDAP